jgi:hypothetical protein
MDLCEGRYNPVTKARWGPLGEEGREEVLLLVVLRQGLTV